MRIEMAVGSVAARYVVVSRRCNASDQSAVLTQDSQEMEAIAPSSPLQLMISSHSVCLTISSLIVEKPTTGTLPWRFQLV